MSVKQLSQGLYLASQTLPFLMITGLFIAIAYHYGHSLTPFDIDSSHDLVRLSCTFSP